MQKYDWVKLYTSGELTRAQYNILSWYAFSNFMHDAHKEEKYYWQYLAYHNACQIAGIADHLIFAVSQGNIEGLINFNRIAYETRFDRNIKQYSSL